MVMMPVAGDTIEKSESGEQLMKKIRYRHGTAIVLAMLIVINTCLIYIRPSMESYAYTERSATINASNLNVRSGPGTNYSVVTKLSQGAAVTVIGEKKASDGALWYQIRFSGSGGASASGYVLHTYVKFPVTYQTNAEFESYLTAQGFPESYKAGLRQLHAQYPKWVFTAQHTNLDWNTVIQNESLVGRNLVASNSVSSWKSIGDGAYNWDTSSWPGFDGSRWVAASEDIIRYYMDPRNFLDDTYVFQFLLQSYDSSAHTMSGLETMVKGSFLESKSTGNQGGGSPGGTQSPGSNAGGSANPGSEGPGISGPGGGPGVDGGPGGGGGSNSSNDVKLEAPGASVSRNVTERLMMALAPGMTGGPGGSDRSVSSDGPGSGGGSGSGGGPGSSGGPGVSGGPGSSGGSGSSDSSSGQGGAPVLTGSSSYVDIIMNAGIQSGVNPYVLAAMIIQEQGSGTSGLISGSYSGYQGYYNYFNVEAYQTDTMDAIQRGLWYASQPGSYGRPWDTPEKSIMGGAMIYGETYVKAGQNTFYLKKFNVQGSNLYKHQYMTNVQGAASEGAIYAKAYSDEMKNTALEFRIPVYTSMPDAPSAKPTLDGSPNNKLAALSVNGFALTPTFNKDTTSYDLIVDTNVSQVTVNANAIDSKATVSGTGTINLQSGSNDITIGVKAENGTVRNYVIHVVRQNNGPVNDGSVNPPTQNPSNPGTSNPGAPNSGAPNSGAPNSGGGGSSGPGGGGSGPGGGDSGPGEDYDGPGGSSIVIIP